MIGTRGANMGSYEFKAIYVTLCIASLMMVTFVTDDMQRELSFS